MSFHRSEKTAGGPARRRDLAAGGGTTRAIAGCCSPRFDERAPLLWGSRWSRRYTAARLVGRDRPGYPAGWAGSVAGPETWARRGEFAPRALRGTPSVGTATAAAAGSRR